MRIAENFLGTALMLVLVYLLLTNASAFSQMLRTTGSVFVDQFRTLQGRPLPGGR